MERLRRYLIFFLIGVMSYWMPDVLIHWLNPAPIFLSFLLTFAVPTITGLTWYSLYERQKFSGYPKGFPLVMLLGIWTVGPLAIAAAMQPLGGRLLNPDQVQHLLVLWAMFPASTYIMATYSGSLLGLLIASFILL